MKTILSLIAFVVLTAGAVLAQGNEFRAELTGFEATPSISTTGRGEFRARLVSPTMLEYTLEYRDLEGGATLASHVHLGQRGVAGGVSFFLCGGGGKPPCTLTNGTISGTVVPADIVGPVGQGIAAGEFDEIIRAMRAGVTYVNVHTTTYPAGEIRGQIRGHIRGRGRSN